MAHRIFISFCCSISGGHWKIQPAAILPICYPAPIIHLFCCHPMSTILAPFGGALAAANQGPGRGALHQSQSLKGTPILCIKLVETQKEKLVAHAHTSRGRKKPLHNTLWGRRD